MPIDETTGFRTDLSLEDNLKRQSPDDGVAIAFPATQLKPCCIHGRRCLYVEWCAYHGLSREETMANAERELANYEALIKVFVCEGCGEDACECEPIFEKLCYWEDVRKYQLEAWAEVAVKFRPWIHCGTCRNEAIYD